MFLWRELRRRNVFKVAAAYAIVAWLLIQVASILLPTFDAPRWVMRVFVFYETAGRFSADGQRVAYVSDRSGRSEVFVQPFDGNGDAIQVSTDGGAEPVWSRDGNELFYRQGNRLMAVTFGSGSTLQPASPQMLFEGPFLRTLESFGGDNSNYDVASDGRFVMIREKDRVTPTVIQVVLNWPAVFGVAAVDER